MIFDVDGTLADTERDGHRIAFNQAFEEASLDWHWSVDLYGELLTVTGGKERIKHYLAQHKPEYMAQKIANGGLDEMIKRLHQRKTYFYTSLLANAVIPLRPGVERLLKEARQQDIRLAIATTTTPANVTALLKSTLGEAAIDWFEVVAAGDIVANKKPAADIYDYALQALNLPAEGCLAIEDSRNGILSSLGAGLKTLITCNHYTEDHDFTGALVVVDQLGEPDKPCKCQAGNIGGGEYISMDILKQIF